MELKSSNPKDALGADKLPYHLWPQAATALGALGLAEGAWKYGRGNFRAHGVLATTYVAACKRHLDMWLDGIDRTDVANFHMANALACLGIIADSMANGTLIDDRNYTPNPQPYEQWFTDLTREVPRLRAMFADRPIPYHYTIQHHGLKTGVDVHRVSAPTPTAADQAVPPEES